jgi:hypothetical protein
MWQISLSRAASASPKNNGSTNQTKVIHLYTKTVTAKIKDQRKVAKRSQERRKGAILGFNRGLNSGLSQPLVVFALIS